MDENTVDENTKARLKALDQKLQEVEARRADPQETDRKGGYQYLGIAYRMVIEMSAGVGIGAVLGYALDYWLGTEPWILVAMCILGFIAGIKVMLESAREFEAKRKKEENDGDRPRHPSNGSI